MRDAARRSGLPPEFVESVAQVESGFRPDAVSPKGALGVMQLMPGTARTLGADPHDTAQNIDAGTRLLRELLIKYDGDVVKALAAYNAGEGAVDQYQGMPPYNETRWYVKKVIDAYQKAGGDSSSVARTAASTSESVCAPPPLRPPWSCAWNAGVLTPDPDSPPLPWRWRSARPRTDPVPACSRFPSARSSSRRAR